MCRDKTHTAEIENTVGTTDYHLEKARRNLARTAEALAEVERILKGRS